MCTGAHVPPTPKTNQLLKEENEKKKPDLFVPDKITGGEAGHLQAKREASEETCLAAILILEFTASRPVGYLPGHFGLLFGSLGRLIQLWSVSLSFPWVLATALPSGSAVS